MRMQIIRTEYLMCAGDFPKSPDWESIHADIARSVQLINHVEQGHNCVESSGSSSLQKDLCPIWREAFVSELKSLGWQPNFHLADTLNIATPFDASWSVGNRHTCVELETGDIQHANATLCRMALGIVKGVIACAVLVVVHDAHRFEPQTTSVAFAQVANYLDLWRAVRVSEGLLVVISAGPSQVPAMDTLTLA